MRVLLTGASSFTGHWFARALSAAGHEVVATLTRELEAYAGLRRTRVEGLTQVASVVSNVRFGDDRFVDLITRGVDVLCHHGAEVTDHGSPDFDAIGALANNAHRIGAVMGALAEQGASCVLTGTVFEADTGLGEEPLRAFNPYGLSKALTTQTVRYYAGAAGVRVGRFVIPNPFGPLEEPRFTAYLMHTWREGKAAIVNTPEYIRDNIPSDLLASAYANFVAAVGAGTNGVNPSVGPTGYVESQGSFAERFAREMRTRTGLACRLDLRVQRVFDQPLIRINTHHGRSLVPGWDESAFWDQMAAFYEGVGAGT